MLKKHNFRNKSLLIVVSLLLLVSVLVGGTVALLIDRTNEVKNTFTPTKVTTSVEETLDGTTKKNVSIKNTGTTDAYIRVALVATWQDKDGNVYGQKPNACDPKENGNEHTHGEDCNNDYEIIYGSEDSQKDGKWLLGEDGFWYWSKPVAPGETTGILIESCTPITEAPAGYFFTLEILGSGVQSVPLAAVKEWSKGIVTGIDEDGTLKGQLF